MFFNRFVELPLRHRYIIASHTITNMLVVYVVVTVVQQKFTTLD
jgi:hypothetical protein